MKKIREFNEPAGYTTCIVESNIFSTTDIRLFKRFVYHGEVEWSEVFRSDNLWYTRERFVDGGLWWWDLEKRYKRMLKAEKRNKKLKRLLK